MKVFHISVTRWSFNEAWVVASLLKSPRLFSVFWPILILYSNLDNLHSTSYFQVFQSLYYSSGDNFHSFFQFPRKVEVFIFLFTFFQNYSEVSRNSKVHNFTSSLLFILFIIIWSGRLTEIRWPACISESQRSLCLLLSRTDFGLSIYHLFIWSNLIFLHNSQWITLPTQSCLVLYPFCANLLHSLIMRLSVSSLFPHNLHLLFCCVLSIIALILVLMALLCTAVGRDLAQRLECSPMAREIWVQSQVESYQRL